MIDELFLTEQLEYEYELAETEAAIEYLIEEGLIDEEEYWDVWDYI